MLHHKLTPFLLIITIPLLIFWPALSGNKLITLGDFTGSDLLELHLPFKYILHESYIQGKLPLWSPYLANGFPILAEGQSGPLYPINIILAFLTPTVALNYSIIITFMITGIGTYLYSRTFKLSKFTAVTTAITFMLCAFFIARMKHINMITVAAYLPLGLYFIRKISDHYSFKNILLLSLIIALQITAGHPQLLYFCVLMYCWQILGESLNRHLLHESTYKNTLIFFLKHTFILLIACIIASGITAPQLLSTWELAQQSSREDFTYQDATSYPLTFNFLLSFIYPFFSGNPAYGSFSNNTAVDGVWWENVVYMGIIPFFCAISLIIYRIIKIKSPLTTQSYWQWFFIISAILFFAAALGKNFILFPLIYNLIPGMQLFRFPTRLNLFTLLSLSLCAGWAIQHGINWLHKYREQTAQKYFNGQYNKKEWHYTIRGLQITCILLIIIDAAIFLNQYVTYYDTNQFIKSNETIQKITANQSHSYRIYSATQYFPNPHGMDGWIQSEKPIIELQQAIPGNTNVIHNIPSFSDRGWFEGGLSLKERNALESAMVFNSIDAQTYSKLLGLWNVRYIITYAQLPSPQFEEIHSFKITNIQQPVKLYKNTQEVPRTYLTNQLKYSPTTDETIKTLAKPEFNPYTYALTSNQAHTNNRDQEAPPKQSTNKITITEYKDTLVTMEVITTEPSYLIFPDTYYPGWKATINNTPTEVIKANIVQRAIHLPNPGAHTVTWQYEPESLNNGIRTSIATLTIIILALIANIVIFKKNKPRKILITRPSGSKKHTFQ